ncbi:MAG TPA: CsbD family protein, partial [Solirubrobacteraceae bacterium]|nr:CsbD family protein [Solirubrobacteraceae bacterium]
MSDDGSTDKAKGHAKEALGDLTGDDELKDEGKVDRASGTVKD